MQLNNLRFSDDIVLFAENIEDLQQMLTSLDEEGKKDGMKINKKKTKIMCNNYTKHKNPKIQIEGQRVENVTEYLYLGQLITRENNLTKEIDRRITQGWRNFGQYNTIMKQSNIPICLKRKMMENIIVLAMIYGCETWTLTVKQENKLKTAQRSLERLMLGFTKKDRKRNNWIRNKTKIEDIVELIRRAKWMWAGHIGRMENARWTKRSTERAPYDRKRGKRRPKRRWRDEIEERVGTQWMTRAQDRKIRKMLGRPIVKSFNQEELQPHQNSTLRTRQYSTTNDYKTAAQ